MSGGSQWPEARALAERLVGETGDSVRVVLMYGSRLLKTSPDRHSALDFVVIVDRYRPFYVALSAAGELHRPVGLMTALAGALAPNVLAWAPNDGLEGIAKCLLVSKRDFARALSPKPPDHFLLGRMVQKLGLVWAADPAEESWVQEQIAGAHRHVLDWVAPYVDGPVNAEGLGRRLLDVCYQAEFRPESTERAARVFEAQADHFSAVLAPTLEAAVAAGVMKREGDQYTLSAPVSSRERRRWRRHFRKSKARSTTRWFKHIVTFTNWLPYVVHKVERHTGRTIELTKLERKLPIVFLWPRVIHVLLTRPRREIGS
jgi:hypothetical protein